MLASAYMVPPAEAVQLQFGIACCCDSLPQTKLTNSVKKRMKQTLCSDFVHPFLVNIKSYTQPELAVETQVVWVAMTLISEVQFFAAY
jgi:hypothetical protein